MGETPSLDDMQRLYDQMREEMLEMKQANEQLATDFSSSQEKIQILQKELASSKASKVRRRANMNDIPLMQNLSDSDNAESKDDTELEDEEPSNDEEKNPGEHVSQYKQRMWQASNPWHLVEAGMCKSFGATLTGPSLKWLGSLKPGSIGNFSTLVNNFYEKFEGSRRLEKQTSDLYGIVQGPKESVRDYYNRFNKEMISIKDLDTKIAIECFRKGLILRPKLYNRLTKYPCQTFEEVKSRALAQMRLEEDDAILNTISTRRAPENPNDPKAFVPKKNNWRNHPYSRSN
ncbi:uncharacterized protein LOC125492780 [Beta vulgaris subsp. vulgaris]|uniref:uncharacterized protein LOC125492780 n=1 Tax=Beta vulgaris subsp. vulgaris TaxID=3555 RepID=UPI00203687C7|nr:uncharacterized protein LOC125492780 [Beta vulgaris subsp. vulgaris]